MAQYQEAIAGRGEAPRQAHAAQRGSFRYLCKRYYASGTFKGLDGSTQAWRRRALDKICETHADKPVALMLPRHVRKLRDELTGKPGAANMRLKALKALFAWAMEEDEAQHDPTMGVKKIKYVVNEHQEIEQYKARHPLGTKPRLAFDLLRFTTGRREDAPRLGPRHIQGNRIRFIQAKNEHRKPIEIDIPLHPDLKASIEATEIGDTTFLVTEWGKSYTTAGFGNAVRDWFDQANLRHCSAHGLRKATPTQMAESGATPHELMAVTGHQSLEEVERYTRAAERKKLADRAMAKLKG
jgi:integrase